jgi:hypothetical protein
MRDEASSVRALAGGVFSSADAFTLYADLNDEALSKSPDPTGYVFVYDSEIPWIIWTFADLRSCFVALDIYRRAFGRDALEDPELERRLVYKATNPPLPFRRVVISRDDPIFRLLCCLSIAAKFEAARCPLIFEKASRELGFLYFCADVLAIELDILSQIGYRVAKMSKK